MANVLITGAGRGIGLALVRHYARAGHDVFACVRNPAKAESLNELVGRGPGRVVVQPLDVGDPLSIKAAAQDIGEAAIDILVNNAGVVGGQRQSLQDMVVEDWLDAFKVMTVGPFLVAQAFLENLERSAEPKIMTVTSQLGASTWPYGGMYAYASVKAAVNRVMQILALDLKEKQIVVGLIHPGWVRTEMGGPDADVSPEESAGGIGKVIASMTMADSGKFYKWTGEIHPW